MDTDQIIKRIEWLDKERLNDKNAISELQKNISELERMLDNSIGTIKELDSEITRLKVVVSKVDKFEQTLGNYSADVKKELDAQDKRRKRREKEAKKSQRIELDDMNKSLVEFREGLAKIAKFKKELNDRKEEDSRLDRTINEVKELVEEKNEAEAEGIRLVTSIEESIRKDTKRATDLQGEVSALRKRSDEFRGQFELTLENQRKNETQLNELQASEKERRETQNSFIEKITFDMDERGRNWKEWTKLYAEVEEQSKQLATHFQKVSDSERDVKKAQDTFDEITGQLNRRINEIMEMQRLGEERFRQEWATFKADDQKRWTNHMLTQEELQRENSRRLETLSDQATNLDDTLQEIQDVVQHLSEQTDKRMQTMLTNLREWVAETERFMGSMR
ncbi:MAG: hypothetical protein FVQ83_08815 [Chloroflexi bacterium]|nr:hypothetical protein [Chloroflexota bacterium]